jgi:hypothetical protein
MGIFGYLSKAHLDQAVPTGDVVAKVELFDQRIKTQQDNIEVARRALSQMDAQVDQVLGRTDNVRGAERAVQIRRNQAKERTALQKDIAKAQEEIAELNAQRSPVAAELRAVEAKVGPIKYIAALIYNDRADDTLLEDAVRWVIIIIVLVFDPLAVILLLASQYSFSHFRKQSEQTSNEIPVIVDLPVKEEPSITLPQEVATVSEPPKQEDVVINEQTHPYLYKTGGHFKNLEPMVYIPEKDETDPELDDADELDHPDDSIEIRQAKKDWKHDHPNDSLKRQKKMFERGLISKLPWEKYLKAQADYTNNDAALEAARWAQEQIESVDDSKKKVSDMVRESGRTTDKKEPTGIEGYIQNAEQNPSTIWQRVKKAKGN